MHVQLETDESKSITDTWDLSKFDNMFIRRSSWDKTAVAEGSKESFGHRYCIIDLVKCMEMAYWESLEEVDVLGWYRACIYRRFYKVFAQQMNNIIADVRACSLPDFFLAFLHLACLGLENGLKDLEMPWLK